MFGFLRRILDRDHVSLSPPPDLVTIERDKVAHLWHRPEGLPRLDWLMAAAWVQRNAPRNVNHAPWLRAVLAACLDDLRDDLSVDHRRWRSRHIEGIAPLDGSTSASIASTAERSCKILAESLRIIRGDIPVAPVAIVAITPLDAYIDFTSAYFPDQGEFATSGGLYLNEGTGSIPIIAINAATPTAAPQTVAHELTHHALHGLRVPLWIEEGFTQMMEERVTGVCHFTLDREMAERQRDHWSEHDLDSYIEGDAFHSPEGDTQELAYHLSQWVVRGELTRRGNDFLSFVRACQQGDPDHHCRRMLGSSQRELIATVLGIPA
ncbi:MAG: hypothetical protein ACK5WB_14400 [Phycisphaerales bacterium]|jgi:hypothetical protein|nr:hypothetical protein [Phycisphaeraceae bacterium]